MHWAGLLLLAVLGWSTQVCAAPSESTEALLERAERIKRSDYDEFMQLLGTLDANAASLTPAQADYLIYLRAWQRTYAGELEQAISDFEGLIARPIDATLRTRAIATLVNALTLGRHYEKSFRYLDQLLKQLPQIEDKDVRSQSLAVAALLHNQVGQHELSVGYSERMLTESTTPWVQCGAAQLKFDSLLKSSRLKGTEQELEAWIQRCIDSREFGFAHFIRTYLARVYVDSGRADLAIKTLLDNRAGAEKTRYPRLVAEFDSLLATTYWQQKDIANAERYALSALAAGKANEFTPPQIDAYRVLYEIAEQQGDNVQALSYHKKYMAADKAYLDDVSARQLAFQMAQHQSISSKLQIDALNQQNQVLQMQGQLSDQAAENNRLYLALLLSVLVSIVLWAWRTKRLQLHFMRQAQQDGLTGISNRLHFMQQAEAVLDVTRRTQGKASVLIIDLDHFKIINDAHGHAAGDTVLKQMVTASRRLLGKNDIFGRLGGEEFGILLPDCDTAQAVQVAEQLRVAIAGTDTGDGRDEFPISASFGVTSTSASGYQLQQLLANADAALYQAKRQGRNRVEIYNKASSPGHAAPRSILPLH